jgi:hypothetical protein
VRIFWAIVAILLIIASAITFAMGEWIIGLICGIVGLVLLLVTIPQAIEAALDTLFSIFD